MKRKKPLPWRNAKRRPPAEASAAIRAAEAEREARGLAVVKMVVP